jgi:hypothetical protein
MTAEKKESYINDSRKEGTCEALKQNQVSDRHLTTQNDSEHEKRHEIQTDGHGGVARHRRWRRKEADYGIDERLRGSALNPEADTSEGNNGSK